MMGEREMRPKPPRRLTTRIRTNDVETIRSVTTMPSETKSQISRNG